VTRAALAARLAAAGCVAAGEEADELLATAGGDGARLEALARRRTSGEPLAWVTGRAGFCGLEVRVEPGVYVPRWQTETLARRAAARLPARGVAVDVCTGSGALALVMAAARPGARVVATDVDPAAVACAAANGVEAYRGDLLAPLPPGLAGRVDVVTGVVPYVPTAALDLLPRDTLAYEPVLAYDGGPDGTAVLRRAVDGASRVLRPGGALLLELGGDQADLLVPHVQRQGFADVEVLRDRDGDVRGVEATLGGRVRGAGAGEPAGAPRQRSPRRAGRSGPRRRG
jgi:release factor glutamine methyltransferase